MLRKRLAIGVILLLLLGVMTGCAAELEQPSEPTNTFAITGRVTVDAHRYDAATGTYVHFYHHESSNIITDIGKDWIAAHLGDPGNASTDRARYISLSSSVYPGDVTAAGWTVIDGEIDTDGGLDRAPGNYNHTLGTNQWTIDNLFTADGPYNNVQTTGLNWGAGPPPDSTLMAANTFTAVSLVLNDTLTVTWTLTLT